MQTQADPLYSSSRTPSEDELSYRALLQDYCSLLIGKSGKNVERSNHFNIDGISFTVYYQPHVAPEFLYIRCEVFDIGGDSDSRLISQLLTENLLRYHQHKPVFALCPDTKRVIALVKVSLSKTDVNALDEIVRKLAQDVRQWRNHLLSNSLRAWDTTEVSASSHVQREDARFTMTPTWETLNVTK